MTPTTESPTPDPVKDLYERWGEAFAADPEMPLDTWRAMVEEWPLVTSEPGGVDYVEIDAEGVPAMWITPKGSAEDRVILALHGGGFVTGSIYTHRKLFGHIAKAVGVRALAVGYRRVPEHVHPAPVQDVVVAYRWLLDQGIDARHVAFTGDSAGGGLVVTAMLLARDQGLPLPAAGMPLSPWFDYEATGASQDANAETDRLLSKEFGLVLAAMFLGERGDPHDPYVNPLYGNLAGLPPMFVQVSDAETLLDDSRSFTEQARDAGVELRQRAICGARDELTPKPIDHDPTRTHMRKLIESTIVSLDGVVEAPDRWAPFDQEAVQYSLKELDKYDAFVMGRVTYERLRAIWEPVTGSPYTDAINRMPKHVATRSLGSVGSLGWNATPLGDDVTGELARLKAQPGRDLIKYGTSRLDATLLSAGLVDEIRLWIMPVVIGAGQRIFEDIDPAAARLDLTDVHRFANGSVILTYAPRHTAPDQPA